MTQRALQGIHSATSGVSLGYIDTVEDQPAAIGPAKAGHSSLFTTIPDEEGNPWHSSQSLPPGAILLCVAGFLLVGPFHFQGECFILRMVRVSVVSAPTNELNPQESNAILLQSWGPVFHGGSDREALAPFILGRFTSDIRPTMNHRIERTTLTTDPFSRVPKDLLNDKRLSWKAKGILAFLVGAPANWKVRVMDLANRGSDGEFAIKAALKELRKAGYAELVRLRGEDGRTKEWVWKVADSPVYRPEGGFPLVDNHPLNKKEVNEIESFQESKEVIGSRTDGVDDSEKEIQATWKPTQKTKVQQLKAIQPPKDYPSEDEFDDYIEHAGLDNLAQGYRAGLYEDLCRDKWHKWNGRKWNRIADWKALITGLDQTMTDAKRQ